MPDDWTAPRRGRPLRVLVVDDSATVRNVLSRSIDDDPALEVVGKAVDGIEAVALVKELRPDVVTLDIEMPRLDGLRALERIMREHPTRVVMVSSLTREGADATIRALELGAVDFVEKPVYGAVAAPAAVADEICVKVREAAAARLARPRPAAPRRRSQRVEPPSGWLQRRIVIGSSTGGPQALRELLPALPADLGAPVAVVQHMPAGFTRSLAERLDELSSLHVEEAKMGSRMAAGTVLLAPGGSHMTVDRRGIVSLNEEPPECGVRPSVNVTVASMVESFGRHTLGVVLTGMGQDGTRGAGLIKKAGGSTIVQSEDSCVVWGMPRSVLEAGYADRVLPLERIAGALVRECLAGQPARGRG